MKKVYIVCKFKDKDIHVPSTDYYARNNDSQTDTIQTIEFYKQFDTEVEAEQDLLKHSNILKNGIYVIMPSFVKK